MPNARNIAKSVTLMRNCTSFGVAAAPPKEVQFRINVNDLAVLRALGIDPTRKVKKTRRVEPLAQANEEPR